MRATAAGFLAVLALGSSPSFAGASSPEAAADAFYRVYSSFHPSDGIPDAKARALYEPVISSALDKMLVDAGAAEGRFESAHKDAPPLIEGDLFSSNFEGATTFKIASCQSQGSVAHCKMDLSYESGPKPMTWTDTLFLVAASDGWRVDDVIYGAPFAFGNKGRLTETLRRAIADSGA